MFIHTLAISPLFITSIVIYPYQKKKAKKTLKPPCVQHLEFGVVLAYEGSPSPRRTAWSTSRVRGVEKSKDMYAGAMMSQEECPMMGPKESRNHGAEAHSHRVGSQMGISRSILPEQIWEHGYSQPLSAGLSHSRHPAHMVLYVGRDTVTWGPPSRAQPLATHTRQCRIPQFHSEGHLILSHPRAPKQRLPRRRWQYQG